MVIGKLAQLSKKSQNIMSMIVWKFSGNISLSIALILKNSHILAGIHFIYLKKFPRPNLKGVQYQIWMSVKGLGKQLSSKTNFNSFLQISCSNFKLKLCQRV